MLVSIAYFALARFNSRTPGGVRRLFELVIIVISLVSIHAPREGCDAWI